MTGPDDRPEDAPTDPAADDPSSARDEDAPTEDAPAKDARGDDARDVDARWHEIVANFGERVRLDPEQDPGRVDLADTATDAAGGTSWPDEPATEAEPSEERYVPPPPPPLPRVERRRLWAWLGLFGAPAILLIFLIFTIPMPTLLAWGLVAWFIGGFGWLVWLMPPGPRDPGDDGARI